MAHAQRRDSANVKMGGQELHVISHSALGRHIQMVLALGMADAIRLGNVCAITALQERLVRPRAVSAAATMAHVVRLGHVLAAMDGVALTARSLHVETHMGAKLAVHMVCVRT